VIFEVSRSALSEARKEEFRKKELLVNMLASPLACAVWFTQKGHKFLLTTIYFVSWDFESDLF
jgi:hypothetical protein